MTWSCDHNSLREPFTGLLSFLGDTLVLKETASTKDPKPKMTGFYILFGGHNYRQ